MKITVSADYSGFNSRIRQLANEQMPFIIALALTRTGQGTVSDLRVEIGRVFDRPTSYTLNALFLRKATKTTLTALIGIKNQTGGRLAPIHWLITEITGGQRNIKALERAFTGAGFLPSGYTVVPAGGAKRDQYGNVSSGQISQILAQLRAAGTSGSRTLMKRSKRGARASDYFVVLPTDKQAAYMAPGIYSRKGHTSRSMVFLFLPRTPTYQARFDFFGVAERSARRRFPEEFKKAVREVLG